MKRLSKIIPFLFALTLSVSFTAGCRKTEPEATCPFTSITWENTWKDITDLEGEPAESYDSIYDGVTYTYPKEYEGRKGTIKYMSDAEEKLVCMSWMYETDSSEDLAEVYDELHEKTEERLGKSGFQFNSDQFADLASPGDVWYLKSGNVILNTVDTNDVKALQYTFLHPDVSEEKPRKE